MKMTSKSGAAIAAAAKCNSRRGGTNAVASSNARQSPAQCRKPPLDGEEVTRRATRLLRRVHHGGTS